MPPHLAVSSTQIMETFLEMMVSLVKPLYCTWLLQWKEVRLEEHALMGPLLPYSARGTSGLQLVHFY